MLQRMLDRARARQAKLDAMKDKSNDSSCPLRENNRNKVTASTSGKLDSIEKHLTRPFFYKQ